MIKQLKQLGVLTILGLSAGAASAQYVTLTGTLLASNGMPASNYTVTFTPSQSGYVSGTGVVVNTATSCATSTDGSVVALPNPLASTTVSPGFTGTLPAANYYVVYGVYDAAGNVTLVSPERVQQLTATGRITVSAPAGGLPVGASGMKVYISNTAGNETLQGSTTGSSAFVQSVPLVSGAAVPSTNTTICKQIANDAIWPVGTGYTVALVDPSGNTLPGYPMMWQLMGPNSTINLSGGLPYYQGRVYFPTPLMASPLNHAQQSIAGPLNLGNYTLSGVGALGVGTNVPAYPIDVQNGLINTNLGYVIGGTAPNNHILLGDGTKYRDSATLPYSVLSGVPTFYYQTVAKAGVAQPQRNMLNFLGLLNAVDNSGGGTTDISIPVTGTEAKLVTAAGSGVSGNCTKWLSTGGVGDAGAPCVLTTSDYYFSFAGCTIAQTGNLYSCTGTYSGAPFPLANANYTPTCSWTIPMIGGTLTINESALTASNLPYTWTQVMGNGTSGAAIGPTVYCHVHMN